LHHDYTEEDENDEFKVSLFHLIHLFQCNHGSGTNQQILNDEEFIFRAFLRKVLKISSPLNKCSFCFLNHDYTEEDE